MSFLVLTSIFMALELGDDVLDGPLDAALHQHGIGAGDDGTKPLIENGLGEDGGGGSAVAGHVAGLAGHFLDHASAHVLVLVFQLDLLGDGDAVLGDRRRAERFLQDDVSALGTERHLDGAGQLGDAPTHRFPRFLIECNLLGSHLASH